MGLGSAGEAAGPHPDLLWGEGGGTQACLPSPPAYPPPQDFLTKRANWRGSWIGLRDLDIEGEFIWMDNQPLDYR